MIDPDDKEAIAALGNALNSARQMGRDDRAVECAVLRRVVALLVEELDDDGRWGPTPYKDHIQLSEPLKLMARKALS